jgi:O-methyltransferase involved in polyketide biosynthesis
MLSGRNLSSVPETLLIPLWARSVEAQQSHPVLRDEKAVEIVGSLDYDFERIAASGLGPVEICIRAAIMDGFARRFLGEQTAATIVEIGPGLDSRYERVDDGKAKWFELDLPDTMKIRQKVFAETPRRQFLAASVLDPEWHKAIPRNDPSSIMFLAEGVFYYFSRDTLIDLFQRLAARFPGSHVVFDSQSPFLLRRTNRTNRAACMAKLDWAVRKASEFEEWDNRFRVVENAGFGDSPYYDGLMSRLPWHVRMARRFYPPLRESFRVTRVRLG